MKKRSQRNASHQTEQWYNKNRNSPSTYIQVQSNKKKSVKTNPSSTNLRYCLKNATKQKGDAFWASPLMFESIQVKSLQSRRDKSTALL